jgi:hypothetical protein
MEDFLKFAEILVGPKPEGIKIKVEDRDVVHIGYNVDVDEHFDWIFEVETELGDLYELWISGI